MIDTITNFEDFCSFFEYKIVESLQLLYIKIMLSSTNLMRIFFPAVATLANTNVILSNCWNTTTAAAFVWEHVYSLCNTLVVQLLFW